MTLPCFSKTWLSFTQIYTDKVLVAVTSFISFSEMSRQELLEMQRIMRERQQEDYKKKSGMQIDETKGVRYQTILP